MPYEWVQLSIIFTYTVAANTTTRSTLLLAVSSSLDTLNQHFQETPTRSHKKLRNCVCFTERKSNHKVRFYDPLFLRWVFIYYMIYSEHIYRVFERLGVKLIGESVKFSDSKHWSLEAGFTSFDQVMGRLIWDFREEKSTLNDALSLSLLLSNQFAVYANFFRNVITFRFWYARSCLYATFVAWG